MNSVPSVSLWPIGFATETQRHGELNNDQVPHPGPAGARERIKIAGCLSAT